MRVMVSVAAVFLTLLLGATGCVRFAGTLAASPSSVFVKQLCPAARYQELGDFQESWTRWGFLGFPIGATPNVTGYVNGEVERLHGDAVMNFKVDSDFRLYYAGLGAVSVARYHVSGNVIRFSDSRCEGI